MPDYKQSLWRCQAVVIAQTDFESGMLRLQSYARPSKLFTANEGLIISIEGTLKPEKLNEIREAIVNILNQTDKS
jgi:mRNA interferase MazF